MMAGCCSAASPCSHQKCDPNSLCDVCCTAAGVSKPDFPPLDQWELRRDQTFWDRYFLGVAKAVSNASKDPSTKIGAIIIRPDRSEVSFGYNGFPKKIKDTPARLNDRDVKLKYVIHGEENALLKAREDVTGCTMYVWPLFSCDKCALKIIQSGIARVVSPPATQERWKASYEAAMALYDEAGVEYTFIEGEI